MSGQTRRWPILAVALLAASMMSVALAAGGGDSDSPNPDGLDPVRALILDGDYTAAIVELEAIDGKEPGNADVLNLLGYSHRKAGNVDAAFGYYDAALQADPQHRGANEYIGELYLETGQLDRAEERLAVLDKECFFPCEEYRELKSAIKDYKQKNGLD